MSEASNKPVTESVNEPVDEHIYNERTRLSEVEAKVDALSSHHLEMHKRFDELASGIDQIGQMINTAVQQVSEFGAAMQNGGLMKMLSGMVGRKP